MAGRHTRGPGLDQKPENVEAIILRQCRQNGDRILLFHISIIIEMIRDRQESGRARARAAFGSSGDSLNYR
jgi:hypothetical protein